MKTIHHNRPLRASGLLCLCALTAVLCLLSPGILRAQFGGTTGTQFENQLVTLIDQTNPNPANRIPIVLEVPFPFVEVSRILTDDFAKRRADCSISTTPSRLLAWYIPKLSLKNQLLEKSDRYRSLQIQVQKEMEPVRYSSADLKKIQNNEIPRGLPIIGERDVDTVFQVLNLADFEKQAAGMKALAVANLGTDSFTLCIAQSIEGRDQLGGRAIQASVSCATYILINQKILLLTVTGVELSAGELGNVMRLTREWINLLRSANNLK